VLIVDSIPRNAIGKALRREMAQRLASQLAPESRSPSTPMEQVLLAIWRKVLRRDDIGVTDNLFQFGADPLRAEMTSGLIDKAASVRMSTKVLYSRPTGARAGGVLRGSARTPMSHYSLDSRLFSWRRQELAPSGRLPRCSIPSAIAG
jgi:Phosphopantetheine attachment site